MAGTVKLPVFGTVSKKNAVIAGVGSVVLVLGIWWYRQHKAAASSSTSSSPAGTVTDPAGNVCSAVNSATGYCPGTPEDIAAQQQAAGGYSPYLGGGAGSPYGYSTGTPVETTAAFATNAAWAQAAETYLQSDGADAIAAALSKYIAGQQMTTAQQQIVEEAIAAENYPPVAGANGYPPSMNVVGTPTGSAVTNTVPNVMGMSTANAISTLEAAGYSANVSGTPSGIIWSQTPASGTSAPAGGTVDIASSTSGKPPEVPSVMGMSVQEAESEITGAGYKYNLNGPSSGKIWSQTPNGGVIASPGGTVDIASSATGKPPAGA